MDDVGRYLWSAGILLLLICCAMFFSSSEVAIVSLNESRLKKLADEDNAKAQKLLKIKEHSFDFRLWVSTSAMLCIAAACCMGTYVFAPKITELISHWFTNTVWAANIAIGIAFLVTVFISIVFGQTLPKKVVANNPEPFAFFCIVGLKLLGMLFKPITFFIVKTTRGLTRLFGIDPNIENGDVTEEEIRMLVDFGNENGTIELSEREMINNIFEFDDRTADEVMTHRTDIVAVNLNDETLLDVIKLAVGNGFSRIPVYDDGIDDIVGIIYVKDLLTFVGGGSIQTMQIKNFMRSVIYMPETARCSMMFKVFKEKKTHMAVIVDEYGGTAGIVTMEDLLESIVGNIQDEYDQEEEEIKKIDEHTYSLDGGINIEEVERLFNIDLNQDDDTDTLGGLITNTLGRIPDENEALFVTIKGVEFTVTEVFERRIVRVRAVQVDVEE